MFNSWQKFNSWQCVPNDALFILGELIQSTRLAGIWAVLTRMALYRFFVLTLRSMRSWWTIVPPTSTMCQCWSWICRTLFQTLKTADSAMTVCQLSGFDPVLWHLGFFRSLRRFGIVSEKMRNIWPTLIGLLQPRKPILVESLGVKCSQWCFKCGFRITFAISRTCPIELGQMFCDVCLDGCFVAAQKGLRVKL